jgi:hypothetical protein
MSNAVELKGPEDFAAIICCAHRRIRVHPDGTCTLPTSWRRTTKGSRRPQAHKRHNRPFVPFAIDVDVPPKPMMSIAAMDGRHESSTLRAVTSRVTALLSR